jgi:cytoskeletal protein RodZ
VLVLSELGNHLKEARLAKGLSLDELQSITKIQKRYLVGIEEGNYSMMPGKFYIRAFIKQYAEAVGIEPEELFETYKSEVPSTVNEDIPEKLSRVQSKKTITGGSSKILDLLPKILIVVFIIGAIALVWFLAQKYAGNSAEQPVENNKQQVTYEESQELVEEKQNEQTDEATQESAQDTTQEENKTPESTTPKQDLTVISANGDESIYELKNSDKFVIKVVSTGETWVNIKNGKGYSFFQGMMKKGGTESQTFDLSQETDAIVVVGNTASTEIYVNDQRLEYAVSPTKVVRQDITIRYVKSEQ